MATVTIIKGTGRGGKLIKNQTFTLIKGMQTTAAGSTHVTVDGMKLYGCPTARIKVKSEKDFVINGEIPASAIVKSPKARQNAAASKTLQAVSVLEDESIPDAETPETDGEIVKRINKRFTVLEQLALGARRGDIRALFVTGAPGVGKTFGVEKALSEAGMIELLASEKPKFEIVSGTLRPIAMFMKLYEHADADHVLVFDDCDSVFTEEESLNLLKAALDTSKKRQIYWGSDSNILSKADVPNDFEFKGSVIFISNINFRKVRGERTRAHLSALMSRAHFLDLTVHSFREKMLRIEDLVTNSGLLNDFGLTKDTKTEIMEFLRENAKTFNTLDLRTVIKLAELAKTYNQDAEGWTETAKMSLCGNQMTY